MPSFDIVSEVNLHEAANAVDQSNREVNTRFDFKGSGANFDLKEGVITAHAENEFQLQQMLDILQPRLTKRGVDISCLKIDPPEITGRRATQTITLRQGIDSDLARKLVKLVKDSKLKVQAAIQGEQVRVTGKNRDDLQSVIALIKGSKQEMPLQFNNFRD